MWPPKSRCWPLRISVIPYSHHPIHSRSPHINKRHNNLLNNGEGSHATDHHPWTVLTSAAKTPRQRFLLWNSSPDGCPLFVRCPPSWAPSVSVSVNPTWFLWPEDETATKARRNNRKTGCVVRHCVSFCRCPFSSFTSCKGCSSDTVVQDVRTLTARQRLNEKLSKTSKLCFFPKVELHPPGRAV